MNRGVANMISRIRESALVMTLVVAATAIVHSTVFGGAQAVKPLIRTIAAHSAAVNCVAFSPDGKVIASGGGDGLVKFWDVATGQELFTLTGHRQYVTTLAFSADGKQLASAGWDGKVRVWDIQSHDLVLT